MQEEIETQPQPANNDPRLIQKYYKDFYERNIKKGIDTKKLWVSVLNDWPFWNMIRIIALAIGIYIFFRFVISWREEVAKIYQIATVLYDVLKTVVPSAKIDEEVRMICSLVRFFLVHIYS